MTKIYWQNQTRSAKNAKQSQLQKVKKRRHLSHGGRTRSSTAGAVTSCDPEINSLVLLSSHEATADPEKSTVDNAVLLRKISTESLTNTLTGGDAAAGHAAANKSSINDVVGDTVGGVCHHDAGDEACNNAVGVDDELVTFHNALPFGLRIHCCKL